MQIINMKSKVKYLVDHLDQGVMWVQFYKTDGSIRDMFCTRKDMDEFSDDLSELIRVWDVEKEEYRSFNINRIIKTAIVSEVAIW